MQRANITSLDHDSREILRIHKQWWKANVGLDMASMRECFPSGNALSMFNRNGFTTTCSGSYKPPHRTDISLVLSKPGHLIG